MPDTAFLRQLNDLLALVAVAAPRETMSKTVGRTFDLNSQHPLIVKTVDLPAFHTAVDRSLRLVRGAEDTISEEAFTRELMPEIQRKKLEEAQFSQKEADLLQRRILDMPIKQYRVLRPVYGIALPESHPPLRFGHFTIYDARLHLPEMTRRRTSPLPDWVEKPSGLYIECEVTARDDGKAQELADAQFYRFELMVRFFIGRRTTHLEVGVLNYQGPQLRKTLLFTEVGFSQGSAWQGALQSVPLSDSFFSNPDPPFARLLRVAAESRNDMERHVLRCAEWTAEALGDPNAASAFVKAAVALEVLFSTKERGLITPSITAQISEGCAFLLGRSASSAIEIETEVRRLYAVRSAIVHSGKDSIAQSDLNTLIYIARETALTLLSSKKLGGIETMKDLAEHLKQRKYRSINDD
jgi:hypothetical protein